MKKITILFLTAAIIFTMFGCGKNQDSQEGSEGAAFKESVDVLNAVLHVYSEGDLFAISGGDQENAVMDVPGRFDISKTEELDITLGLPASEASKIDDAASMVHLMNGNTFTGAAYHLKDDANLDAFADAVKSNLLDRQWMCGIPDTLIIIDAGGAYVITAYGNAEIIEIFKNNALSALDGAKVVVEEPIG